MSETKQANDAIKRYHLEPQTGVGFTLQSGQLLKIIDPQGEQVSDLTAFSLADKREWLSSGRTIDYANTIYLTTGHTLYSNRSRCSALLKTQSGDTIFC
jgi:hypothetical protein